MNKKSDKLSSEEKLQQDISSFISNKSKIIVIFSIVLVLIVLSIFIFSVIDNSKKIKTMEKIQELEEKVISYNSLEENEKQNLLSELSIIEKSSGYTSIKASYLIGLIYYYSEEWQNAYENFMKAVEKDRTSYIASLALVNAASCSEMTEDYQQAISLYNSVITDYEISGMGDRAYFNIARIYYQTGELELAKTTLNQLKNIYPDSLYTSLAVNLLSVI